MRCAPSGLQATTRAAIVAEARSWIGTPYRHQASLKGAGCDCFGLVRGVWRAFHGAEPEEVPPYSRDWGSVSGKETLIETARRHMIEIDPGAMLPGDVLVFRIRRGTVAKHTGIVSAPGRFIHAQEHVPVCEVALSGWWRRHVAAAFAFPAGDLG
ncbi:NlpC/P60 family protein [Microbaculum marinum]|uniref:NlpC/P60 family protein n=1 Tax=Microbaculum marinum TaxID=1764581 RepID=A0AAW9RMG4_9HYPH